MEKVTITAECWEWTGCKLRTGYGQFNDGRSIVLAHRWAYENFARPVPAGCELDHLCRNRACVNPWHLEPVSHTENLARGSGAGAMAVRTNRCKRGHEFTPENTRHRERGRRACRTCDRMAAAESAKRNAQRIG